MVDSGAEGYMLGLVFISSNQLVVSELCFPPFQCISTKVRAQKLWDILHETGGHYYRIDFAAGHFFCLPEFEVCTFLYYGSSLMQPDHFSFLLELELCTSSRVQKQWHNLLYTKLSQEKWGGFNNCCVIDHSSICYGLRVEQSILMRSKTQALSGGSRFKFWPTAMAVTTAYVGGTVMEILVRRKYWSGRPKLMVRPDHFPLKSLVRTWNNGPSTSTSNFRLWKGYGLALQVVSSIRQPRYVTTKEKTIAWGSWFSLKQTGGVL